MHSELMKASFIGIAEKLLVEYENNQIVVFNTLSVLRRINNYTFYQELASNLLLTFFSLFDFYYQKAKNEPENLSSTVLKEIIAILGNIGKYRFYLKSGTSGNFC